MVSVVEKRESKVCCVVSFYLSKGISKEKMLPPFTFVKIN